MISSSRSIRSSSISTRVSSISCGEGSRSPRRSRGSQSTACSFAGTADASPRYAPYALDPARFRDHLAYLRDAGFTALTIDELAATYRDPHATWPKRPIAVTFDDGFEEMATVAMPALADAGFRAKTERIAVGF